MIRGALEGALALALLPATSLVHTAVAVMIHSFPLEENVVVVRALALEAQWAAEDLERIAQNA